MRNYIFMQDKTPCYFAASTQRYLADRGVVDLVWPGNSPDLNPITCSGSYCNKEEGYLFSITAWSYRPTFFLGYYLPKLSHNIYSLKFY